MCDVVLAVRPRRICCGSWMRCKRSSENYTGPRRFLLNISNIVSNSWPLTWLRLLPRGWSFIQQPAKHHHKIIIIIMIMQRVYVLMLWVFMLVLSSGRWKLLNCGWRKAASRQTTSCPPRCLLWSTLLSTSRTRSVCNYSSKNYCHSWLVPLAGLSLANSLSGHNSDWFMAMFTRMVSQNCRSPADCTLCVNVLYCLIVCTTASV